jgi:hypothetical protein
MKLSIRSHSQTAGQISQTRSVRRLFANTGRSGLRTQPSPRLFEQRPAASYFELLMSLPAKRSLPQLLRA